jgi:hypothetical protein
MELLIILYLTFVLLLSILVTSVMSGNREGLAEKPVRNIVIGFFVIYCWPLALILGLLYMMFGFAIIPIYEYMKKTTPKCTGEHASLRN